MAPLLYARPEAARSVAISLRLLDSLIQKKIIKIVKIGKRTLVPHTELEKLAKRGTCAKSEAGGGNAQ
jgi:hypothetical protein